MRKLLTMLLPLLLAAAAASADPPATGPATQAQAQAAEQLRTLPTFGIALAGPPGFRPMADGAINRIAQWARIATGKSEITSLIQMDVDPAAGRVLKDFAATTALANNGTLRPGELKIDGEPAYEITAKISFKPFGSRTIILVQHEDQFYTLSAMEVIGDNCDAALAAICNSIKWLKIEDVADHLTDFRAEPLTLFDLITMNLPAAMRSGTAEDVSTRSHWSLLDLKTNREEFIVDFQLAGVLRTTFDDVRTRYGDILKKRFSLATNLVWKPIQGADAASRMETWVTDAVEVGGDPAKKDDGSWIRWALVNARTHVVVIIFNLGSRPAADLGKYNAAVDRILATIKAVENP